MIRMSHVKLELDFRAYLHEKMQESRRSEFQAYLMFLTGAIFFIGGILISLNLGSAPAWFIFVPYHMNLGAGSILSLGLIVGGIFLMILGTIMGTYHYRERTWLMKELQKAYMSELQRANFQGKHQIEK